MRGESIECPGRKHKQEDGTYLKTSSVGMLTPANDVDRQSSQVFFSGYENATGHRMVG